MKRFSWIFAVPVVGAFFCASGAFAADAENGRRMAQLWCAACHVVAPEQRQANTQAPPFSVIAKKPNFDAAQVALFLLLPHPRMPDMGLSRSEAADLAAYIATQKK
jgi:mono/diheme cytochrome c family protein